ncbi:hypothetical protein, partial [Erythrobacter sp.]|uniref:hypothetical protein n=1 Tax=Erythrobacter sp. TaxID=1042 RepID=UPI00311F6371
MRSIASWLTGKFILFLVLMAAFAVSQSGIIRLPCVSGCGELGDGDWTSQGDLQRQAEAMIDEFRTRLDGNLEHFSQWTADRHTAELASRRKRLDEV